MLPVNFFQFGLDLFGQFLLGIPLTAPSSPAAVGYSVGRINGLNFKPLARWFPPAASRVVIPTCRSCSSTTLPDIRQLWPILSSSCSFLKLRKTFSFAALATFACFQLLDQPSQKPKLPCVPLPPVIFHPTCEQLWQCPLNRGISLAVAVQQSTEKLRNTNEGIRFSMRIWCRYPRR